MIVFDFELKYFEEVEKDVEIAKLWYCQQNPGTDLEERFANAIKEVIKKLCDFLVFSFTFEYKSPYP
jgi:hypothetical protein